MKSQSLYFNAILLVLFCFAPVVVNAQIKVDTLGKVQVYGSLPVKDSNACLSVIGDNSIYCNTKGNAIDIWMSNNLAGIIPEPLIKCASANSFYPFINCRNRTTTSMFSVSGGGQVNAYNFVVASDSLLKEDVKVIESSLTKIRQLRGVTYHYKKEDPAGGAQERAISQTTNELSFSDTTSPLSDGGSLDPEILAQMDRESIRPRIGLIAQEVEAILPEVVFTSLDGTKGIAYSDIVGLLVEAIKEQQTVIDEQQGRLDTLTMRMDEFLTQSDASDRHRTKSVSSISEQGVDGQAELYQNAPNPFGQSTVIRYYLSEATSNAAILIYDLQGKQLRKIVLNDRNHAQITIQANELRAGMYIYALIADGREIDNKRMIITD